jgi:tetratricopeptide (TPR) repeat protein
VAEVLQETGDLARAEAEARQALNGAQRKKQRSVEGCAWRVLGSIHAAAGHAREAEAAFARSVESLERLDDALECARTWAVWGRWLRTEGDRRADALLDSARETFEECGTVLDLALLGF